MIKDCHVGVKGIIFVDGACLVLKKKKDNFAYWDIPGGRVEDNESLEETLLRELEEEMPSLNNFSIKEVVSAHRLGHDLEDEKGLVFVFFKIEAVPFEVVLTEHIGYEWITKDTLHSLLEAGLSIEPKYYEAISRAFMK